MKKIDLSQTVSIVANLGVLAGIVFLALELRYNSNLGNAGTAIESISLWNDWKTRVISDQETADLYLRGLEEFNQLSPVEQVRFDLLMRQILQSVVGSSFARTVGLVPTGEAVEERMLEGDLLRLLDSPGFQQWWFIADKRGITRTARDMVSRLSEGALNDDQ